ncbi:MAG: macro domain-containing protein [Candidatus Bipolaricaulia bacterium]
MIEYETGDILEADVQALVNTVNCVGVMGKGVALQFKLKFPENFRAYEKVCNQDELEPGRVFVFDRGELFEGDQGPQYIINFPTKTHWRKPSKLEYIEQGMDALVEEVQQRKIESIAIPPLGCGNGGLDWEDVEAIIERHMEVLSDVRVVLYPPGYEPKVDDIEVETDRPNMTPGRALVIKLLDIYQESGYRHGKLEVQKLAYLLQAAGQEMRLDYVAGKYGPYANNLNHVLQRIEGHFTEGYGDREQDSEIRLLDGAVEKAEEEISGDEDIERPLARVQDVIEGFETPFGLELLTTVLWVAQEDPRAGNSVHQIINCIHDWNRRKKELFTPEQIQVAWNRLREQGWIGDSEPVPA